MPEEKLKEKIQSGSGIRVRSTHLVKEELGGHEDMLELRQLQRVLLERLGIGVDFLHLIFQLLECRLGRESKSQPEQSKVQRETTTTMTNIIRNLGIKKMIRSALPPDQSSPLAEVPQDFRHCPEWQLCPSSSQSPDTSICAPSHRIGELHAQTCVGRHLHLD